MRLGRGRLQLAAAEVDTPRLGYFVDLTHCEIHTPILGLCRFMNQFVDERGEICGRHGRR